MKSTWGNAIFFLAPAAAFLLTILCVPLVSAPGDPMGLRGAAEERAMAHPANAYVGRDRVFSRLSCLPSYFSRRIFYQPCPFFIVVTQMFVVGFYDDLRRINPATKLIGQIISAADGHFLRLFSALFYLAAAGCPADRPVDRGADQCP